MTKQSQGFVADNHNDFYLGSLSEINEEVMINDRNDKGECLVLQAANMNNDVVFHDNSRSMPMKKSC